MHQTGGLRNEEANAAAWEAGKGAAVGGAKVMTLHAFLVTIFSGRLLIVMP